MDDASAQSDTPTLAEEFGFLAVRAGTRVTKLARGRLRPMGLHVRSYSVLALAATTHGRTQREVADYLDLDPSQVVSLVDELEEMALVTREVVSGDRRARLIRATPRGRSLLLDARQATAEAESEALGRLTPNEKTTLVRLLRKTVVTDAEDV